MVVAVFILTISSGLLFTLLGIAAIVLVRQDSSPRVRDASALAALCCGAFALGATQRAGLLADRHGWVDDPTVDLLVHELQLIKAGLSLAMALLAMHVAARLLRGLRSSEQILAVVSGQGPRHAARQDLCVTPREADVLALIGEGVLSDAEISARLVISPHTAHSHVQNLMRKAGVSSRRELLWLALKG